jgi:hypothetical protein
MLVYVSHACWIAKTYLVGGGLGVRNGEGVVVVDHGYRRHAHDEESREGEEDVEEAHCLMAVVL